jgi:cell division protein FtsB
MSFPTRLKYSAFSILLIVATINFVRTTASILESSKRLNEAKADVLALESRRNMLEKELEYKKTDEFIEEKARNDLNLAKPGEEVVAVPGILSGIDGLSLYGGSESNTNNFWLWVGLFFGCGARNCTGTFRL